MDAGYQLIPDVVSHAQCDELLREVASVDLTGAGSRDFLSHDWCRQLAAQLMADARIGTLLPPAAVVVQCTWFDKSTDSNWLVAYHQDLSIPVRQRVDSPLCSAWSEKQGVTFVQPPLPVLEALVAVRVHMDDNHEGNGSLRVIPNTHRRGRLKPADTAALREQHGEVICLAERGSALLLKPLLLHASSKAREPAPRRVLHFLFGPPLLPEGLEWAP